VRQLRNVQRKGKHTQTYSVRGVVVWLVWARPPSARCVREREGVAKNAKSKRELRGCSVCRPSTAFEKQHRVWIYIPTWTLWGMVARASCDAAVLRAKRRSRHER